MTNQTYNILLVEDDKQISSFLKSNFEARNHSIEVIHNGSEALRHIEKIKENHYTIILLDLMLPGANGWEILAKIRSISLFDNIPVIMLTGIDDDSTEARALYDGADDYVIKPCTMKVLLARIEANLRKTKSKSFFEFDLPYSDGDFEELTDRELEILSAIVKGFSNKDIAKEFIISEQTVMNHVKSILKKLKVKSRIQAAIVAFKYNLIK